MPSDYGFEPIEDDPPKHRILIDTDDLPAEQGFSYAEIQKKLDENKVLEHNILWSEYYGDIVNTSKKSVDLDILLPNGLLLPTVCPLSNTVSQLKQTIHKHMKKLPCGESVKDVNSYLFSVVCDDGDIVEIYDENRPISAVQMFLPVLALREAKDNEENRLLNNKISALLGMDIERMEQVALTDELRSFRTELFHACQNADQERGTDGVFHYEFPEETILPNVGDRCFSPDSHSEVHEEDIEFWWFPKPTDMETQSMQRLQAKISKSKNGLQVWYNKAEGEPYEEYVGIKDILEKTPSEIIKHTLETLRKIHENPADFILQVAGKRTFITRNLHIIRYEYIRSCFENYRQPIVLLRRKMFVFADFARPPSLFVPYFVRSDVFCKRFPVTKPSEVRSFWDFDDNMRIRLNSVSNLDLMNVEKVYFRMAISVGRHVLASKDSIKVLAVNPRWLSEKNQNQIEFEIYMKDIPESAQLSMTLVYVESAKTGSKERSEAYINLRLFDWQNRFIQGKHTLCLWPFPADLSEPMNLLGAQGNNHSPKATRLEIEICSDKSSHIEFPPWPMIEKYAEFVERHINSKKPKVELERITPGSVIFKRILQLRNVLDGSKLSSEDQNFVWDARFKIQELFPQMVLILADNPLVYRQRETLCEFYALLNDWPQLHADTAMELLDARFSDRYVRAFAVKHLDKCLDNDQLLIYLLPLVQSLKYEAFAISPLADMLLRRSLMNYRIGHTFFWLLMSELSMFDAEEVGRIEKAPMMYIRFCLLFEGYCRGNLCHLESMAKQKEMVEILTELSLLVKTYSQKDLATKKLRSELLKYREKLEHVPSPLDPCCRLGELMIENCKVLGSAKMPLMLRWKNPELLNDMTVPHHEIIFKNGDDLRQDLLTLQVMRIFDAKWKNYNLDYCLTLYEVLPMGQNIGMIHVVQNCHTIFQIQCAAKQITSTIGIDQKLLNKFIYDICSKERELDSKKYMECVDRFTYSLAGYSIATYVIGIKDRHQDNLMLVEDGRLFHIDFGHIMGHSKMKFGVNRERTDFVLTDHFLSVISHGKDDIKGTFQFKNFRDSCLQGFMLLHYHRRFFISLFRMMRCMGLPELRKDEDINYLYTSLMFDKQTREEVEAGFLNVFDGVVKSGVMLLILKSGVSG